MRFENIKVDETYLCEEDKETVLFKRNEPKLILTEDQDGYASIWTEKEDFDSFESILPEEGLLVNNVGSLVYRTSETGGYGFSFGKLDCYYNNAFWGTFPAEAWKPATPEQEKKFAQMIRRKCEEKGLFRNTKIESHANVKFPDSYNSGRYYCVETPEHVYNTNGCIFHKGNFAVPKKEEDKVIYVIYEIKYSSND